MACLHFDFVPHLPDAYAALLWDVFFVQRCRGLSLEEHFPWLRQAEEGLRFATLSDGGRVLAGLTVRRCNLETAAIGLVCVHPEHRGQGLSAQLLQQALRELDRLGLAATTLWTGKPGVYEAHGFALHDDSLQCQVNHWPASAATAPTRRWPDANEAGSRQRGLPAYAYHGLRVGSDAAELLMLLDPLGVAVAEWRGDDAAVVDLLATVMPARWRLHALQGDSLPQALTMRGATVTEAPQRLQMWRPRPGHALPDLPRLRLLDRI